jgi:hypothetical protein
MVMQQFCPLDRRRERKMDRATKLYIAGAAAILLLMIGIFVSNLFGSFESVEQSAQSVLDRPEVKLHIFEQLEELRQVRADQKARETLQKEADKEALEGASLVVGQRSLDLQREHLDRTLVLREEHYQMLTKIVTVREKAVAAQEQQLSLRESRIRKAEEPANPCKDLLGRRRRVCETLR